jgi:hypothetical protein
VVEMARRGTAARARARRGVRLGRIIFVWVWDVVLGDGFVGGDGMRERKGLYKSPAGIVWIDALYGTPSR